MKVGGRHYRTVWMEGRDVFMINQPLLPHAFEVYRSEDHRRTAEAIKTMVVRGAGAIGAAAGYAMAQAALEAPEEGFRSYVDEAYDRIVSTRPTAYDLFYAAGMVKKAVDGASSVRSAREEAVAAARSFADRNAEEGRLIGEVGSRLIESGMRILTHCNAGWLAFVDWGSALAPVYVAAREGKRPFVYVDETRPRCQGARLTAWELLQEGIDHAVIADNAAGFYMYRGMVDMVITGADRVAANGDVANKVGTYEKAVVARANGIPFYVAVPLSTIDPQCACGDDIPIEERDGREVATVMGRDEDGNVRRVRVTPEGSPVFNPAFDVTPAEYITGIITPRGVFKPAEVLKALG